MKQACGALPINGLLLAAGRHKLTPKLVSQCNSGDTAGDRRRVVGYAAIEFLDAAERSSRRLPGPQPRSARFFTPPHGQSGVGRLLRQRSVRPFQRYRDYTGRHETEYPPALPAELIRQPHPMRAQMLTSHGIGTRWCEVKLDQRSLPMLRPGALISCSRIANLEVCWNGRTRLHDQMKLTKAGAER